MIIGDGKNVLEHLNCEWYKISFRKCRFVYNNFEVSTSCAQVYFLVRANHFCHVYFLSFNVRKNTIRFNFNQNSM